MDRRYGLGKCLENGFQSALGAISQDLIENSVFLSQRSGDMSSRRGDEVVVALGHDDLYFIYVIRREAKDFLCTMKNSFPFPTSNYF